ncbi:MAG: adenylate/guanylate cyclase domain-containing protein [Chloroflexota bacterium]
MASYAKEEAAERAGVSVEELSRQVALGILSPGADGRFTAGAVRKAGMAHALEAGGVPLEGLAAEIKSGRLSLDFLDNPAYETFALLSELTFEQLSTQTGVPVELLMTIREAVGSAVPLPSDLVRENELAIVPMLEAKLRVGYPAAVIESSLRTMGDSLRRFALTEAAAFRSHVIAPMTDRPGVEIAAAAGAASGQLAPSIDAALLAVYHALEVHDYTANIIEGFEAALAEAGLKSRLAHPPAMCFLDITGYTRLTQERGDAAAADLATTLARLVERTSVRHGGRPVKWLGDGVMFFFPNPGPGVAAALEMVAGVADAGLPPAHVGLHAGPVIFQAGDYYGQTVNVASRIAEYARPGEVLVSQDVVDASDGTEVVFREVGPVDLKGVSGALRLHAASRPG